MKTKYLFQLTYLGPELNGTRHQIDEFIVMESWDQAKAYWARELNEPAHEIITLHRSFPVIAVGPEAIAVRYGLTP